MMRKTMTWKKRSAVKCAAVLLFILLTFWMFGLLSSITRIKVEELALTPLIADACGWELYTVENGSRREISSEDAFSLEAGRIFYLSRTLTKEQEDAGYTFLMLDILRPCAVFLDGDLLYTNCPGDDIRFDAVSFPQDYTVTDFAPGETVRCSLPAHYAGRRLTIATAHTHDTYDSYGQTYMMPGILLSSHTAGSALQIAGIGSELMPAAGFATLTLLLSDIWLFALFQGIRDYPSLLLILAALTQMLSHLRQFSFLSPVSFAMDSPLAVFIPIIEVMLPCIWLFLQMKDRKGRLLYGAVLGFSAVVSLISPIGNLFGGLPFYNPFLANNIMLFIPLATLLIFAVREALQRRNRIFIALLFGLGIAVCLIAVLYVGSRCGEGFYADQIINVLNMRDYTVGLFLYWCAVILLTLSTILTLYQIIRRISGMRTELALQTEYARQLDSRLMAQKEFYEAKISHENALRALRHDMAGHLNTLAVLLRDDKTTEAKKYLDGLAEYHREQTPEIFCKNPYMNAVLQNYAAKCRKQQIELTCNIGIGDEELPATELCLILNNALENAVEGSLTMPEGERIIKVQATVRQDQFLLRVSNRFDKSLKAADGLPVSTKDGDGHGYGLSNIRQAAGRRGGQMEYRVLDGYFVLDVTLGVN